MSSTLKRICVYCGSSSGNNPLYHQAAAELGLALAQRNIGLVYGGASIGLMGAVADAVMSAGGEVIGVIPQVLVEKEVSHPNLTELKIVSSMHERKAQMAELADGFIALPGGLGTLEELFEILTWAQLGLHQKPCGLLNVAGYYDGLIEFLDRAVGEGFVREWHRGLLLAGGDVGDLLGLMVDYRAVRDGERWIGVENS